MTLGWKVIIWKGSKIKITEETQEVIKVKIGDEGTGEDDKEAHKEGLESKEEGFGVDKKEFSEKKHEKEQLEAFAELELEKEQLEEGKMIELVIKIDDNLIETKAIGRFIWN